MKLNCLRNISLAIVSVAIGVVIGRGTLPPPHHLHSAAAPATARDSYKVFDTLVDIRSQILHNYVETVDDNKLMDGAIQGMLKTLDPYSNYFAKEELAQFDRAIHGQFSGIGAEISQDLNGNFIITSPMEDSPALKAGIYAGDRILKVDNESVEDFSLKDLISRITGTPGSQVTLTVLHEGDKAPTDITITRAVVQVHSIRGVEHKPDGSWDFLIDSQHRIAYVRINNFMETTAEDIDKALLPLIQDQDAGSLKGIILDLRFNPGGLLDAGIDVCERFLDSGVIVSTGRPDSAKRTTVREATKEHTYPRIPLVVLINEYSASASEIVAGALKDHRRAVLIGTRTFGKGSVQSLLTLDNGNAALKLTTAYYYLPSGQNITRKKNATTWGVEPDPTFNIPLTEEENRQVLSDRRKSEVIRRAPTTAPAADKPATRPTEATDRQLQRALEILLAYEAFGPTRDFTSNVTTTRPSVSASVSPPTPKPSPETAPASTPE